MNCQISIQLVSPKLAKLNQSAIALYQANYFQNGEYIGHTTFQLDCIKVGFRKHYLINVGKMKVTDTVDKATLIQQTKRQICRYFWRLILLHKVYFWSDATVCQMDFSPVSKSSLQALSFCKTFQALLTHIGSKYYGEPKKNGKKRGPKIAYLRPDISTKVPFFMAANPIPRGGLGLISFGAVSGLDLIF